MNLQFVFFFFFSVEEEQSREEQDERGNEQEAQDEGIEGDVQASEDKDEPIERISVSHTFLSKAEVVTEGVSPALDDVLNF